MQVDMYYGRKTVVVFFQKQVIWHPSTDILKSFISSRKACVPISWKCSDASWFLERRSSYRTAI